MWKSDTCPVSRGAEESARHLIMGSLWQGWSFGRLLWTLRSPQSLCVASSGKIRTALALEPELVFPPQNVL